MQCNQDYTLNIEHWELYLTRQSKLQSKCMMQSNEEIPDNFGRRAKFYNLSNINNKELLKYTYDQNVYGLIIYFS